MDELRDCRVKIDWAWLDGEIAPLCSDKLELLLAESLRVAHASGALRPRDLALVTVDTTVQPKAVGLLSAPGIGPIISIAMVAAIGTGNAFTIGRDFAA